MWRAQTTRKGRHVINAARQLATETAPPKPNLPPPIPPPQPKSGGFRFIKFIGLSLPVAAGGIVGYAWYDQDFRKQLEDNVPYAKEVLENILPESPKPVPPSRDQQPQASSILQQASMLNVQEEAAKSSTSQPLSSQAVSYMDMYRTAHCTTEEENENVKPADRHGKGNKNRHSKHNDDVYASYTVPTCGRDSSLRGTPSDSSDTDETDDSDEEDEEDSNTDRDEYQQGSEKLDFLSKQKKGKNTFENFADQERILNEEILAGKKDPLHGLAGADTVQPQAYQQLDWQQTERVKHLLQDNDDDLLDDRGISTDIDKSRGRKADKIDPSTVEAHLRKKDEDERADNAALEVVIHKLLTNSQNFTDEAVNAQREVASAIRNHTKLLRQAMDDMSDILQKDAQWEAAAIAHKEKELAIQRANELVSESKKTIEKLRSVIAEGKNNKVTQYNPAINPASKQINGLLKELGAANMQVKQAEAEANVMQKYKDLVDKGRKQFQQELESLLPSGKLGSGKKLSEDELNALIAHAHRRIEQLQKQVAEQVTMERQRLGTALEAQRQEDDKLTDAAVAEERLRLQDEWEAEKSKQELEFLAKMETEVRKQLARQAAAHSDHLKDVLAIQHDQLSTEFNRVLNVKLLEERERFQSEVAGWISRLKGIEAAIDARATSEKLARCAQDLWLACIALNSAIHFGSDSDDSPLIPLRGRVETILKAGNKHPFVETVANTFSSAALDRGVSTEEELRNRFSKVSRICRRVGLVYADNMSLYKYLVSYLHSFVVFDHVRSTSEKEEIDLSALDNFALLAYAHYWMEKGKLELALRFMIQLTGEPRRAASDWIREAMLYLETRQAAYTLTAYASATGLANTF